MNVIDLFNAVILGVIEGITEFLPISSTGHLIVAEHLLKFKDVQDVFTVVVQLGAILAVVWYYRHDLWQKTVGLMRWDSQALQFWKLLVIGTIPAGIFGLALDKSMERIMTPVVVAIALIIGGVILWIVDRETAGHRSQRTQQAVDFKQLSTKRALLVGLGQSVAIVPGVSRSGATIVAGLASGLNRPTATAFSFYLSLPVMVLASGLKIAKHGDILKTLPGGPPALFVGMACAFVTALAAVSWLLKYISHHNFRPFAYYRIALGVLIITLLCLGVL